MNHASKLPNVKTTIFTIMSRLAAENNAINLSQGFPNFECDAKLISLVNTATLNGHNQYAPMAGIFELRDQIAQKYQKLYDSFYHPETEITITAGATQAIFTAIATFVRPDDEVVVLKPAYDCYEPAIEVQGAKVISVQLNSSNYKIDWLKLEERISEKTKMIIINTPHNPSGTILTEDDMLQLQRITDDTNIIVLSDEVYEHIVFDENQHHSVCKFKGLKRRSIISASFGKTFHATGWKVGYCCAPKELMYEIRKVHQFNVFCVHHPTQVALAEYLKDQSTYLELNDFYQQKRDLFLSLIKTSKFKFSPCQGTYFQSLDYTAITNEGDVDFAKRLVTDYNIATIPLSEFNVNNRDDKLLRFCFAKRDDTLKQAAEILNSIN